MSFENGYKAKDYIDNCIKKYNNDSMLFTKAIGIINMFSNQPEWPHNYEDMKKAVLPILGNDIEWILHFSQQWLSINENMHKIEWPEYTKESFMDDLKSFTYTISDLMDRASMARVNPLGLYSMVRSTTVVGSKPQKIFRIIRMDGSTFDLVLSRRNIEYLEGVFGRVLQDGCELE